MRIRHTLKPARFIAGALALVALFVVVPQMGYARLPQPRKNDPSFDAAETVKRCPPIAFVKRHHFRKPFGVGTMYCWNVFTPGGGICVYDPAHPEKGVEEIFHRDNGTIFDMSVSCDAKRLLFAWMGIKPGPNVEEKDQLERAKEEAGCTPGYKRNIDSFHIYEINIDGTGLHQITKGRFHDVSPIYLPDGRIGFVSTRGKSYSMCQPGLAAALFTMNADGSDIRRIEFSTLADVSPCVLDNGSILFMRWEYLDKSLFTLQSLWTINPDGTRLQLFYGNTITNPNVIWQAKPIPETKKTLCTLGPHHGNPVGAIGILNRSLGTENPAAMRNITPEYDFVPSKQVHSGGGPGDKQYNWAYRDPWPVSENLFLVAYGGLPHEGTPRYRLYAMDADGNKAPLYEDKEISCFNPIPLVPRRRPEIVTPAPKSNSPYGTYILSDVYQGLLDNGIRRGDVKEIRIMTQVPKRCNMRGRRIYDQDPLISRGSYYVKACYGTVPVERDGSAFFKAPAGVELYFQAVDRDGKEISRMGSLTQIMPGESQSCVGCHEPRTATNTSTRPVAAAQPIALRRSPSEIKPPPWGKAGPIDFVGHVQPVFDKYCVKCHAGPKPDGDLDLSGDKTRYFNMAYENLLAKNLVHFIYINRGLTDNFLPMQTGSHVSKLTKYLEGGHKDAKANAVKMADVDRRKIYTWIDANCPYYATYDNTRPGTPGSRDLWHGPWKKRLDGILGNASRERKVRPAKSGEAGINLTHPENSSVLAKNLAKSAGGLADDKAAAFPSKSDKNYIAALAAITEGKKALDAKPRVDMPGAKPVPCPVDYGGLYTGFAGP